jgi:hypothetical protein
MIVMLSQQSGYLQICYGRSSTKKENAQSLGAVGTTRKWVSVVANTDE